MLFLKTIISPCSYFLYYSLIFYMFVIVRSFDRDWKKIEAFIGSKTVIQVILNAKFPFCLQIVHTILSTWFMCVAYRSGFFHLLSNPGYFLFLVIILFFPSKRGGIRRFTVSAYASFLSSLLYLCLSSISSHVQDKL